MFFKRLAAAALISVLSSVVQAEPLPTIALTFDHYRSTYDVAFPIMKRYGLVGTFYVEPRLFDHEAGMSSEELREMQRAGWEIGVYSGHSLFTVINEGGESAARDALTDLWFPMALKGFPATSLAPASRSWSGNLGKLAAPLFDYVRVLELPGTLHEVTDPHYIRLGYRPSLSGADTAEHLQAMVRAIVTEGGLHPIIVHQVGVDSEPTHSVSLTAFESLCIAIASERDRGRAAVATFHQAAARWSKKPD